MITMLFSSPLARLRKVLLLAAYGKGSVFMAPRLTDLRPGGAFEADFYRLLDEAAPASPGPRETHWR